MKKEELAPQLRGYAAALSENGKRHVSTLALCAMYGAEDTATKARVRRSIEHMVTRGELERVKPGVFSFHPDKAQLVQRDGLSFQRMWKIIRTERAGCNMADVAATTRLHNSTVSSYVRWLEEQGYVARCGQKGNTRLFRTTEKAFQRRETPYPPVLTKEPFRQERDAAIRIIRELIKATPNEKAIAESCRVLAARFGSQNEKSNQVEKKEQAT